MSLTPHLYLKVFAMIVISFHRLRTKTKTFSSLDPFLVKLLSGFVVIRVFSDKI